jgi:hypothetical protein
MGTQGVQMKGVLPWLVRWALRAGTRDFCPALHYFKSFFPIAQHAGQAVMPDRLSLNVCLWWEIKKQAIIVQKYP